MAEHIVKPTTYFAVFGALILLTALTVGLSRLELTETWHTIFGLSIAVTKATLVILFFMHVFWSTRLTWLVAVSGILWLGILILYTLNDYATRDWSSTLQP
jgi:cytochrome c oxidase subunit 4